MSEGEPPPEEELQRLRERVNELEETAAQVPELQRQLEEARAELDGVYQLIETVASPQVARPAAPNAKRRESTKKKRERRWGTSVVAPIGAFGVSVAKLARENKVTSLLAATALGMSLWGTFDDPFQPPSSETPPVAEAPRIPKGPTQDERQRDETPTPSETMDGGEARDETAPGPPSDTQAPGPSPEPETESVVDTEPEPQPPEDGDESPVDEVTPPDGGGDSDDRAPEPDDGEAGQRCRLLDAEALETVEVCL